MPGSPLSDRKKLRLMMALTIFAWATQTLLHQWGAHGQEAPAGPPASTEQFVPGDGAAAILELKSEATATGAEVKLRQICRWSDADRAFTAPLAELVIARFEGNAAFASISLEQVRHSLADAGINLGRVRFAGATVCTVSRTDVKYDEAAALQQWIDARDGKVTAHSPSGVALPPTVMAAGASATAPASQPTTAAAPGAVDSPVRSLRELIIEDAAIRLNLPIDQLQFNFNPADEKFLNLAEPQFKFNVTGRGIYGLGELTWDVLIVTEAGNKKISLTANARAWQKQVVLVRPVAFNGVIQPDDVAEKRVLSDHLPDAPLLSVEQAVGQQASRELKPGTVLTAPMINPVELARAGQFVTVTLISGAIRIKTVGRAMESGTFGQTVRVKNEANGELYQVLLTGPQEGTISPTTPLASRN